jgi:hypothetical protein
MRRWIPFVIALVLAAIPFTVGKIGEFKTPGPFDSSGYVYSAQSVLSGARIGVDHRPSAQMGTLLVNMLGVKLFGFSEVGPEIIQMLFQAAALLFMGLALYRLYGLLAAGAGVFIASFYLSAPHIAKFGNVKEQYMIAVMVIGVSCYVLGQLRGRWWWTLLAGMALSWGPLFKETGTSALGAVGFFVLLQGVLKWRPWKATLQDIGLLAGGFALGIAPIVIWLSATGVGLDFWPYRSIFRVLIPAGGQRVGGYVTDARKMIQTSEQAARIMRYYASLSLPIVLALLGLILAAVRRVTQRQGKADETNTLDTRFIWLFGVWWALDMAYVWISPRTYEQYFLPLNASAAMCGAFVFAWYGQRLGEAPKRAPWMVLGGVGLLVMLMTLMPLIIGISHSPHSGSQYINYQTRQPERRRGYRQRWQEIQQPQPGEWQRIGDMIRAQSDPNDTIYVWGWYPGIYVQAQRLSNAPKAFEGNMHTVSPEELSVRVQDLLDAFAEQPPKFFVDSRKRHFPWNRPNLELWPKMPDQQRNKNVFIDPRIADSFDQAYGKMLTERVDADEAGRYAAMKPLRDYVMQNYSVAWDGAHAVFKRK